MQYPYKGNPIETKGWPNVVRTITPLVAMKDNMRIKVADFKGKFSARTSTEPKATIYSNGMLSLNTYIAKLFGVTAKTKLTKASLDWDAKTQSLTILFNKVKKVDDPFELRNSGYREQNPQDSIIGGLMYNLGPVFRSDEVGILYPYKKVGNMAFDCEIVPVSKKDNTPWGVTFSLAPGFAKAEDEETASKKSGKRKKAQDEDEEEDNEEDEEEEAEDTSEDEEEEEDAEDEDEDEDEEEAEDEDEEDEEEDEDEEEEAPPVRRKKPVTSKKPVATKKPVARRKR